MRYLHTYGYLVYIYIIILLSFAIFIILYLLIITTTNNKVCVKAKQKAIQAWTSMNTFEMNWNISPISQQFVHILRGG